MLTPHSSFGGYLTYVLPTRIINACKNELKRLCVWYSSVCVRRPPSRKPPLPRCDRYRDGWDGGPGAGGRHCHQAVTEPADTDPVAYRGETHRGHCRRAGRTTTADCRHRSRGCSMSFLRILHASGVSIPTPRVCYIVSTREALMLSKKVSCTSLWRRRVIDVNWSPTNLSVSIASLKSDSFKSNSIRNNGMNNVFWRHLTRK